MDTGKTAQSSQPQSTISLLDLISVLVKRRWLIFICTTVAAVLVVLYSLYTLRAPADARFNKLPNYYIPVVKVRLLDEESSSISSALSGSDLGFLASLAGGTAGSSSADLAQALLSGNQLLDELVEEFEIIDRFQIQKNPKTNSRGMLREAFEPEFDASTGILTLGFKSVDKVFAAEILTSAVDKLEKRFDELTMESVLEKKRFLEESIAEYEIQLRQAQTALINFQKRNNIIDIQLQTEYQLLSLSEIEAKILETETDLNSLRERRRPDDPEVLKLAVSLNVLKTRRDIIKLGQKNNTDSLDIPLSELPGLSAMFANLTGDIQILQVIYTALRSQLETTRIEERDNSERFQIIEEAEIPEVKAGPSRGKICIIVTLSAFFFTVFLAFILEYFDRVKADPTESAKLIAIKQMLLRRRKK